jgi:chromate transporter
VSRHDDRTIGTRDEQSPSRADLFLLFLRLGATAFGGPAAHIAMMQRELVDERRWIDRQRFLDLVGAVNLIPGPNSTELAIAVGAELHGRPGLALAGIAFITPAFLIVLALAALYGRFGTLPDVTSILLGVKAVVLAIIAQAVLRLAAAFSRGPFQYLAALLALVGALAGIHELALILACGVAGALRARAAAHRDVRPRDRERRRGLLFGVGVLAGLFPSVPTVGSLLLYFLYVGSVLYGSGYVLVAVLRRDLVESLGWISERQLLDAVAIGQVTPGPVFTTATFIGYLLGGSGGAVVSTLGIFLPSFLFVLATHRLISRLRANPTAAGFLDGVNAAAIGAIAAAIVTLGRGTLVSMELWIVAVVSAVILLATRINPTWLIVAGAIVGWLVL